MELRLLSGMLLRVSSPASRCSLQAAGMKVEAVNKACKACSRRELRCMNKAGGMCALQALAAQLLPSRAHGEPQGLALCKLLQEPHMVVSFKCLIG
jgi:hypothetical protein